MWHLNRASDSRRVKEEGRVTVPRDRGLDLPAVIGEIERSNKTCNGVSIQNLLTKSPNLIETETDTTAVVHVESTL